MDKKRILTEAQQIAKEYSFWMVSGDIAHLYGYIYETSEKKYELEIKFEDDFPNTPPRMTYHSEIKELLGDFELDSIIHWSPDSNVVYILHELREKIVDILGSREEIPEKELTAVDERQISDTESEEEYITPDLNAYPPDFPYNEYVTPSDSTNDLFYTEEPYEKAPDDSKSTFVEDSGYEPKVPIQEDFIQESRHLSVDVNTELSLIQQQYAYDQSGPMEAQIDVYITITLTKTFIISIDFMNFPERPILSIPDEVKGILKDPYKSLDTLKNWDPDNPSHIVDILHEMEKKLYFIKEIEVESKKISGEYQCEEVPNSLSSLKVNLLTYGFKEYTMSVDLDSYPNPPKVNLSSELQEIIQVPITELKAYKNWEVDVSESVELIREISWLVDKNSRINFEIDLLKDHYKKIEYDPSTATLLVEMKGKMKTEALTFEFQIKLPIDYPMKMPEVKVINEFELEAHEKIKNDLDTSFDDFFKEWTPFSYLVDLFNLISKKIFEVSVVSCVICHRIECPSCSKKIAGDDNCHAECPHCNRAYHNHCWEQTIKSFGKCGFCLR
ncbi:MAG: hypothetical protein ACFFDY_13685 [Candidatus Thorarchaeota archaeon]